MKEKTIKILKIVALIFVIGLIIFFTIKLLPLFKNISTEAGRLELKNKIENLGINGIFAIIGLMFAQMFLAILPGEPVEVIAGMCYGPLGGMLVIFLGVFLTSSIIFLVTKKFGKSFLYSFISKEKLDKFEKNKIFSNPKKMDIILFILYFIPGTPKDFITYAAGLLPIKTLRFLLISTFARFPSIISSTIAGSNIIDGNWKMIIGVYTVTFAVSGVILYAVNKKDKNIIKSVS